MSQGFTDGMREGARHAPGEEPKEFNLADGMLVYNSDLLEESERWTLRNFIRAQLGYPSLPEPEFVDPDTPLRYSQEGE